MDDTAIKVDHVSKIYKLYNKPSDRLRDALHLKKVQVREHAALNDISFEVHRGETVGIIGTNGSGKSTILKIITGVLNPTAGDVTIDGRISALLELGAGFNMEYTGIENVYLNGTMMGFSNEEIEARMDDILSFADIGDFVHQPVKTYSSGMFVRLAFAVAINIDPEILIVDEALSVGDVFFQSKCYHKFEEFKKEGKTILFVSHDLSSISKYCDRVILLDKGIKRAEGGPKQIVDMYKKLLVGQLRKDDTTDSISADHLDENGDKTGEGKSEELWKDSLVLNSEIVEYGEKNGEIVDFAIIDENGLITNAIEKDTEFTIKVRLRANALVEHPISTYTIKNLQGTAITGTNTLFEGYEMEDWQPGEEHIVTFTQTMSLQGGEYLLSVGCTGYIQGDFHVYHRLYDVCNLTVVSHKNTVGFFDAHSRVTIDGEGED
ncbi:MAG: ABC transporter ATP-binding protein [Lachnospiraceae bacterium]|nr:ABC transporter ATP-binding protein [Lachnospiraceae bacterium]